MPPKKRKNRTTEITGEERRLTRLQARLNATPPPEIHPNFPGGSLPSPSCSWKDAKTFPRAAKSFRRGKVTEKGPFLVITPQEYLRYCSMLPKKAEDRTNDSYLQLCSDADKHLQMLSQNSFGSESEMGTHARRSFDIRSTSRENIIASTADAAFRVSNSSSRRINDVRCNSDVSLLAPVREDVTAENVPRTSANVSNRMIPKEENACSLVRTSIFGLTEMVNMCDLDSGMDEVESPAVVRVRGYRVKQELGWVLRSVIDKHGDIAANFIIKTPESRSSALEDLCQVVQKFQGKRFSELTEKEIESSLSRVFVLGTANMEVGWLQKRLENMLDAKRKIKQSSKLKEMRDKNSEVVKELKTKLKDYKARSVALKEMWDQDVQNFKALKRKLELYPAKMEKLQVGEKSAMKDLEEAEGEAQRIKQITSDAIGKVKLFYDNPLMEGLI